VAVTLAGGRLISASLVETRTFDPQVLAAALGAALAATVAASALPAIRVARTSPLRVLRNDAG
jgi:hypothetical protein